MPILTSCWPTWGLTSTWCHPLKHLKTLDFYKVPVFLIKDRVQKNVPIHPLSDSFINLPSLRPCWSLHVSFLSSGFTGISFRAAKSKSSPNGLFVLLSATEHCSLFIVRSLWPPLAVAVGGGCHLWLVEHEGLSETAQETRCWRFHWTIGRVETTNCLRSNYKTFRAEMCKYSRWDAEVRERDRFQYLTMKNKKNSTLFV